MLTIENGTVVLACKCGIKKQVPMSSENVDEILDAQFQGWYTVVGGATLCPKCTRLKNLADAKATLTSRVHGRANNEADIAELMEGVHGSRRHSSTLLDPGDAGNH